MGRSSERVRSSVPLPLPRARSLELLLDERGDPSDRGRSLQVLAHDCDISGWRRQPHRSSAHELAGSPRLGSGPQPSSWHNRSFDALVDRQSAPFRSQSHRKSANELPTPCTNTQIHPHPQHNRSFEMLVGDSTNPWPVHHRLVDLPPASPQPQQVDPNLNKTWEGQVLQRSAMEENKEQRSPKQEQVNSAEWRGQPLRRSVHEMVARIQNAQANQALNSWKERQQRVNQVETKLEDNMSWEKQNYERTSWRGDKREPGSRYRHREDEASSESSEGEDDHDRLPAFKEPGMIGSGIPDYENVGSCPWQVEATELVSEMPYRSRSTVYSPTMDTDLHNDSGYSTKLYGSSKGPSPSLSGNLECEHLIPGQPVFPPSKLCDGMQRPHSATRTRFEREDPIGTNIVAASLV